MDVIQCLWEDGLGRGSRWCRARGMLERRGPELNVCLLSKEATLDGDP